MDTLWISEFVFIYFQCFGISSMQVSEKGTRVSTFESDLGDWMNVSSIGSSWHRSNQLDDHTMIATHGTNGYSMAALSIYGTAGTALVYTNSSFMEPICLSLWYQFYHNAYDCSFSIYKITDGNQTLLFTVDGNFTFYDKWINISVDVYGQDPFKMALEADFKQRDSTDARWIIIDDTSIAYRPCQDKSQTTNLEKISTESSTMFGAGIPVIIISTMVVMIVAAVVIIVIVCNRKRRAKNSKLCQTPQNTTAAEIIDSSDYNVINYNEMTDISTRKTCKINENRNKTHTKQHQPQNIQISNENICNKYESLSTKRTSVEHIYESDSVHTNQYESLTNQRELDTNTYESTEQGLPQNMKTSIEQDENICNRYESLSTNRNSAEHMHESDTIPINHYQSLKQQKGLEEHTYESTKHALPVSMNQELSQYESLTIPPESDKHTYESTEHASQVSMKQQASQYESLTNPPESDKHVYASTKSPS